MLLGILLILLQGVVVILSWKLSVRWGPIGRVLLIAAMAFMVHRRILALQAGLENPGGMLESLDRLYVPLIITCLLLVSMLSGLRARKRSITMEGSQLFESAFEGSSIGLAFVGLDGKWIRVNPALERILGYTAAELTEKTFQDLTHPDDLDKDLDMVQKVIDGLMPRYTMKKRYVRRDGALVHARLTVTVHRGPDDKPLHFISQIEDLTLEHLSRQREYQQLSILREAHDALETRLLSMETTVATAQESRIKEALGRLDDALDQL